MSGAGAVTASLSSSQTQRRGGVAKKKKRLSEFVIAPIWFEHFKLEAIEIEPIEAEEAQPAFIAANLTGTATVNAAGFAFELPQSSANRSAFHRL